MGQPVTLRLSSADLRNRAMADVIPKSREQSADISVMHVLWIPQQRKSDRFVLYVAYTGDSLQTKGAAIHHSHKH